METAVFTSKRRPSVEKTDFGKCVICQDSSNSNDHELNYLTKNGLQTFKNAVHVRKDEVYIRLWLELENEESFLDKRPLCHRRCRSSYTHKKELEKYGCKKSKPEDASCSHDSQEFSTATRSTTATDHKTCCFICNKERDSKGSWQLTLVATETRQKAIHEKAKYLDDHEMLIKIEGYGNNPIDMIAADFRYHKSCIDSYMNRKKIAVKKDEYDLAFHDLVDEISDSLIKEQSVFYVSQLLKKYREYMLERGANDVGSYRSDRLKKRLLDYFGSDIQIVAQRGKSSLVCSSTITVQQMCALAASLKKDLEKSETVDSESENSDDDAIEPPKNRSVLAHNDLYMTAKHLRGEMKQKEKERARANESLNINYESASNTVPDDLFNCLAWMMVGQSDAKMNTAGRVELTEKQERKVLNVAQEIMANTTSLPMPKHVGLSVYVLKQTGSKEVVRVLNKFGNSISYEDAQRYITAQAHNLDVQTEENGIFIPSNVSPGRFTQYAFDNLDFKENTNDGTTLHSTSHAIYQYYRDGNCEVQKTAAVPPLKSRRRAIDEKNTMDVSGTGVGITTRREARSISGISLTSWQGETKEIIIDEDFVRILLRLLIARDEIEEQAPSWSEFNEIIADNKSEKQPTIIAYGPLLPESPTNSAAVQSSLDYCMQLTRKLGQESTVVTVDQAIYDVVKGIVHEHPEKYKSLVVRVGGFHIAENFLGSIGFFMKESGIEDIIVESGLCKRGTANKVIAGKDYYKMFRCHCLVSEAMFGLGWDAFEDWLDEEGRHDILDFGDSLSDLHEALKNKDPVVALSSCIHIMSTLEDICPEWEEFVLTLPKTAKYWLMHTEMTNIIKRFVKAERVGDWEGHLKEIENMLPYTVVSKHTNYMSCLPLYLKEMKELPVKHHEVYANFMRGHFAVHRTKGKFNGIWTDMALEQTYNKEGKTSLLKGISLNPAAREKYIKAAPFLTSISEGVKDMAQISHTSASHHHGQSTKQILEEQALVEKIRKIIRENMINPFTSTNLDDLINISTGQKAQSTEVINARQLGIEAMKKAEEEGSNKIVPPSVTTFSIKTKPVPSKEKNLVRIYQEESCVSRTLCFLQTCDEQTRKKAFSHEWTNYPSSLFEVDPRVPQGYCMRKGSKSDFLSALKESIAPVSTPLRSLPDSSVPTAFLVDAMAFVNRYQFLGAQTFDEAAKLSIRCILNLKPSHCTLVNIIGDRYDFGEDKSIKTDERQRRDNSVSREFQPAETLPVPEFKMFLKNQKNKANYLDFLTAHLLRNKELIPRGVKFIFGGTSKDPGIAHYITSTTSSSLDELSCAKHEEADTRIFAHLYYCVQTLGCSRVVIHATDTDVIMLSMYYYSCLPTLQELWIQLKSDSYLPVHELVDGLSLKYTKPSKVLTSTLISVYVLSGCDTVSYPFKRGKKKAAIIGIDMAGSLQHLSSYGDSGTLEVTNDIISDAKFFFTALYGKRGKCELNALREHMYGTCKSDLRILPPTDDAFHQHLLRALYQLALYKNACNSDLQLPPPTEFGRVLIEGRLWPILMTIQAKPDIQASPRCTCKTSKCLKRCSCAKAGIPCCVRCSCMGKEPACGRVVDESSSEESASEDDD